MKSAFRLAATAAALAPVSAFAHAGGHAHVEGGLVSHMLQSPFHLGLIALMLGVIGLAAIRHVLPARQKARRDRN